MFAQEIRIPFPSPLKESRPRKKSFPTFFFPWCPLVRDSPGIGDKTFKIFYFSIEQKFMSYYLETFFAFFERNWAKRQFFSRPGQGEVSILPSGWGQETSGQKFVPSTLPPPPPPFANFFPYIEEIEIRRRQSPHFVCTIGTKARAEIFFQNSVPHFD